MWVVPSSCRDLDNVGLEEEKRHKGLRRCFFHATLVVELFQADTYPPVSGMDQFLRHQELCFPEKKPLGAELERQAAFSGLNWFETEVKATICVWLQVLCFRSSLMQQTDSGQLPSSFTNIEKMSAQGWGLWLYLRGLADCGCELPLVMGNHDIHWRVAPGHTAWSILLRKPTISICPGGSR